MGPTTINELKLEIAIEDGVAGSVVVKDGAEVLKIATPLLVIYVEPLPEAEAMTVARDVQFVPGVGGI